MTSDTFYSGSKVTYNDISEDEVFMASPETPVPQVAQTMVDHWVDSIFIVNDKEEILGIITDGVILSLVARNVDCSSLLAKDVMANPVYCVRGSEPISPYENLKKTFSKRHNRVNRVAIIDEKNRLTGVVNMNFLKKIGRFSRTFEIRLKKKE